MSKGFREPDFAQVVEEQLTSEAMRRVDDINREQAERARGRRALGAEGVCEDCGGEIGAERLAYLPDATRCVGCQARRDAGLGPQPD